MPPILTLTTDFGQNDPFVGIMKGVILNIAPTAQIVDLTHQIEPQNITQAAQIIKSASSWFPKGTVHLAVVDPGVGGPRRPIAVRAGKHYLVGPDNGIFSATIDSKSKTYELTEKKYFLKPLSSTFHGRDLFAPAAAWIAKGIPLTKMGRPVENPVILKLPQPTMKNGKLEGEIIHIDRFGNLTTNISAGLLQETFRNSKPLKIRVGKKQTYGPVTRYNQCETGEIAGIINSWDHLEIFCREGNAARKLKCKAGAKVTVATH